MNYTFLPILIILSLFIHGANLKDNLELIVMSDSHLDWDHINAFGRWFQEQKLSIDYLIFCGDFDKILPDEHSDPQKEKQAEENVIKTLTMLKQIVNTKIIFVPGNHEPLKNYNRTLDYPNDCYNVHNTSFKLADDLVIFGLGGAIPFIHFVNGSYVIKWDGFPYTNDAEFSRDLIPLFNTVISEYGDIQYVVLTHIGPFDSPTAIEKDEDGSPVFSGSKTLAGLIQNYADLILFNVHGHTHSDNGFIPYSYNALKIMNPGALELGDFGEITLERKDDSKWKLTKMQLYVTD